MSFMPTSLMTGFVASVASEADAIIVSKAQLQTRLVDGVQENNSAMMDESCTQSTCPLAQLLQEQDQDAKKQGFSHFRTFDCCKAKVYFDIGKRIALTDELTDVGDLLTDELTDVGDLDENVCDSERIDIERMMCYDRCVKACNTCEDTTCQATPPKQLILTLCRNEGKVNNLKLSEDGEDVKLTHTGDIAGFFDANVSSAKLKHMNGGLQFTGHVGQNTAVLKKPTVSSEPWEFVVTAGNVAEEEKQQQQ